MFYDASVFDQSLCWDVSPICFTTSMFVMSPGSLAPYPDCLAVNEFPSGEPTGNPTGEPTGTYVPSGEPTGNPTGEPTDTYVPSGDPTGEPTDEPTGNPTGEPTAAPTAPSGEPTGTHVPSGDPTGEPTNAPTMQATYDSTNATANSTNSGEHVVFGDPATTGAISLTVIYALFAIAIGAPLRCCTENGLHHAAGLPHCPHARPPCECVQ